MRSQCERMYSSQLATAAPVRVRPDGSSAKR